MPGCGAHFENLKNLEEQAGIYLRLLKE